MQEESYEKELARQVRDCHVDPRYATALSTAAWTELSAVKTESFRDLTVHAVISGGIDHNGTAPGDPAGYYEEDGKFYSLSGIEEPDTQAGEGYTGEGHISEGCTGKPHTGEDYTGEGHTDEEVRIEPDGFTGKANPEDMEISGPRPGTVNIFLFINRELTESAMLRALMICAEAKEAVVRELLLGSCYSSSLASGSGTDGCVIASRMNSGPVLTDASAHSKLGELIGKTVKGALREALLRQTGANGARQFRVLERVKRYGITQGTLYDQYKDCESVYRRYRVCFQSAADFDRALMIWGQNSNLVLTVSLYVHLMDQESWGLVMPAEVIREGTRLLRQMLYVDRNHFLQDVYPDEVFDLKNFFEKSGTASELQGIGDPADPDYLNVPERAEVSNNPNDSGKKNLSDFSVKMLSHGILLWLGRVSAASWSD